MATLNIAVIVLGQTSVPVARQIVNALPNATLYGLEHRTEGVDRTFTAFGETVRELFTQGTAIVGLCAAGILIRTIAPLLSNKWQEPPVIAIAEDGSAVVPLLGGLHGVNDLARQIGTMLETIPAITTTGDIRFRTALLSPPQGYRLANPDDAKTFLADLLSGETVRIEGDAPWLKDSQLAIVEDSKLTIQVTEQAVLARSNCLVYHPVTIVIEVRSLQDDKWEQEDISRSLQSAERGQEDIPRSLHSSAPEWNSGLIEQSPLKGTEESGSSGLQSWRDFAPLAPNSIPGRTGNEANPSTQAATQTTITPIDKLLKSLNLSPLSIAAILTPDPAHSQIRAISKTLNVPIRWNRTEARTSKILYEDPNFTITIASSPIDPNSIGETPGQLAIIGTGPGSSEWMSPQVKEVLRSSTDWIGYETYLNLVEPLRTTQQKHIFDNREELDRASLALDLAAEGRSIVMVSSGDPGIYAMAAAVFEVLERDSKPEWNAVHIQVCPGISAMQAAAAQVGAPLGHDFCAISLSDILKPWETIAGRISAAAQADFAIAFYNPISKTRTWQLEKAKALLLNYRSPETPIVLARNLGRPGQQTQVKPLGELSIADADMRTVILIGSSKTRILDRPDGGIWVYTPRRYDGGTLPPA